MGASPSPFAICGLPPLRRTGVFDLPDGDFDCDLDSDFDCDFERDVDGGFVAEPRDLVAFAASFFLDSVLAALPARSMEVLLAAETQAPRSAYPLRRASRLHGPAPAAEKKSQMKQYSTAGTPPLVVGQKPAGK